MLQQVQKFAEASLAFCAWAETAPSSPESEASAALKHLSTLYMLALSLPEVYGDEEPTDIAHDEWQRVYERFGSLPFNYYSQCFNPIEVPREPPVVGDVADDLADVWRDLKGGLSLFNAGHLNAACWEWRNGFWQHWGRHAASGIYALHSWRSEHQ